MLPRILHLCILKVPFNDNIITELTSYISQSCQKLIMIIIIWSSSSSPIIGRRQTLHLLVLIWKKSRQLLQMGNLNGKMLVMLSNSEFGTLNNSRLLHGQKTNMKRYVFAPQDSQIYKDKNQLISQTRENDSFWLLTNMNIPAFIFTKATPMCYWIHTNQETRTPTSKS